MTRRSLASVFACVLAAAACKGTQPSTSSAGVPGSSSATPPPAAGQPAPAGAAAAATPRGDNLAGLASGAIVVTRAESADSNGDAWFMFDEDPRTGWTSQSDKYTQPTVVEFADRGVVRTISIDTARTEYDGRVPKEVLLEVSDTSATDGFKPIATLTLSAEQKDGQVFPVAAEVPGRYLRLTVKNKHTEGGFAQIMEVRAIGEWLSHDPIPNVTGKYGAPGNFFNLKQDGTTVTGCYEGGTAPLQGGMEGRLMRFTYKTGTEDGPAIAVFARDGTMFMGYWKANSTVVEHPVMDATEMKRAGDKPGDCPQWKPPQDQLGAELKKTGRVRLYGINFNSDSDVIRAESKPTLDQVVAMLKANGDVSVAVEGHTDSTSTAEHNQQLSQARANAVKQYLVGGGIDARRLNAVGLGSTKPVATNDTPLGRAANRRVELAKK